MAVRMKIEYRGELLTEIVHGPSATQIETDAPVDNMGRGSRFSPTDLVAASLISCAITTMAIRAQKEGLPFGPARGEVNKQMTDNGPRRIEKLGVLIEMPSGLSEDHKTRLEAIARSCPVALSLSPQVNIEMRFQYPSAAP